MPTFDSHANFSYSTVLTAPSPATSGTSLVLASGEGALMPTPPFDAVVWPAGAQALNTNAEVVRVTAVATDTLTITRGPQTGTDPGGVNRTIVVGDQVAANITLKVLTDIESAVNAVTVPLDVAASTTFKVGANTQVAYHIPLTVEGIIHIDGALVALVDSVMGTIDADQVSGNYVLEINDAGTVVECTGSTAATFTIQPNATVAMPLGSVVEVFQAGTGQVTITAGAGVTLVSDGNKAKTAAQYATIGLRQRVIDTWVLSGDLAS